MVWWHWWCEPMGVLVAVLVLCASLPLLCAIVLHSRLRARTTEDFQAKDPLPGLCDHVLGTAKLPDRLILDWAERVDMNESFWDDFNLVYAEMSRCRVSDVHLFDYWHWRDSSCDDLQFFDISLALPYEKLVRIGLGDIAQWRMDNDDDYDTLNMPTYPTEKVLPKDLRRRRERDATDNSNILVWKKGTRGQTTSEVTSERGGLRTARDTDDLCIGPGIFLEKAQEIRKTLATEEKKKPPPPPVPPPPLAPAPKPLTPVKKSRSNKQHGQRQLSVSDRLPSTPSYSLATTGQEQSSREPHDLDSATLTYTESDSTTQLSCPRGGWAPSTSAPIYI